MEGRKSIGENRGVGSGLKPSTEIASQCSGYLTKHAAYRSNYAMMHPVLENRRETRLCKNEFIPMLYDRRSGYMDNGNKCDRRKWNSRKIKFGRVVKRDGVEALAAVIWIMGNFFSYRITFCVLNHSRSAWCSATTRRRRKCPPRGRKSFREIPQLPAMRAWHS